MVGWKSGRTTIGIAEPKTGKANEDLSLTSFLQSSAKATLRWRRQPAARATPWTGAKKEDRLKVVVAKGRLKLVGSTLIALMDQSQCH